MFWGTKCLVFLIFFHGLVYGLKGFAGLGREVPASEGFSQSCFFDYNNNPALYVGVCSGVLVDSETIITAAHCLDKGLPEKIFCGSNLTQVAPKSEQFQIHPHYKKGVSIGNTSHVINDIAVIKLSQPVPANEVKFIDIDDVVEADRCAFFGFSKVSGKPRQYKVEPQYGWEFSKHALKWLSPLQKILQVQGLIGRGSLLEVGDSGGPLMCQFGEEWRLLGVASSRDFNYNSLFTPVVNKGFDIKTTSPIKSLQDKATLGALNFKWRKLHAEEKKLKHNLSRVAHLLRSDFEEFTLPSFESFKELSRTQKKQTLAFNRQALKAYRQRVLDSLIKTPNINLHLNTFSLFKASNFDRDVSGSVGDLVYNYVRVKDYDVKTGLILADLKVLGPSDYFLCHGELLCTSDTIENVFIHRDDLRVGAFEGDVFAQE